MGEHLDGKAGTILQAGSLIIALTGATTLPSLVSSQLSGWMLAGTSIGFLAFIGMTVCAILAWRPTNYQMAGSASWDNYFDLYISKEVDDAYNQVLYSLTQVITANMAANTRKARYVTLGTWLLVVQVVGILAIAVASSMK